MVNKFRKENTPNMYREKCATECGIFGFNNYISVLSGNNQPLLVGDIFFKIDKRSIIILWKGVKCFCWGVQNEFKTIPADFGTPPVEFHTLFGHIFFIEIQYFVFPILNIRSISFARFFNRPCLPNVLKYIFPHVHMYMVRL